MPGVDLNTLQNILDAGKKEFLEKGFRAASLRNIVREAGVTTGAFYGYFKSKEELFRALTEEPARTCLERFREVQEAFARLSPKEQQSRMDEITEACMDWMVDYIYSNFDAFKLVLCCSEGTEYEDYIHTMVEIEVKNTHRFMAAMESVGYQVRKIDSQMEHILASSMLSGFFEVVVHDMPQKQAKIYVHELREFYNAGWMKIMGL